MRISHSGACGSLGTVVLAGASEWLNGIIVGESEVTILYRGTCIAASEVGACEAKRN
jgi:hypothetical protein